MGGTMGEAVAGDEAAEPEACRFRASSREDLESLAALVRFHVRGDLIGVMAGHCHRLGLMRATGKVAAGIGFVRFGTRVRALLGARGRRPIAPEVAFMVTLGRSDPAAVAAFRDQMLEHALRGHDDEDADSVGGWSQRELESFVAIVKPMLPAGATTRGGPVGASERPSTTRNWRDLG